MYMSDLIKYLQDAINKDGNLEVLFEALDGDRVEFACVAVEDDECTEEGKSFCIVTG